MSANEYNWVTWLPSYVISVYHFPFCFSEVYVFSRLFLTCILNIYTHPIVEMVLKVNEGASGSNNVKKSLYYWHLTKMFRGFEGSPYILALPWF